MPPERRGLAQPQRRIGLILGALRRPVLSRLIVIFFLVILAFAAMESIFALWALRQLDWGPKPVGYVFAYLGLLSAIMQGGLTRPFDQALWRGATVAVRPGRCSAIGLVLSPFSLEVWRCWAARSRRWRSALD